MYKRQVVSREDGSGTRGAFIELFGVQKEENGEKMEMTTEEDVIANSTAVMMLSLIHILKTVFYYPFSENVPWLWKMRKMPVRNRRRPFLQKMNSCERTCCVLFHMI